MKTATATEVQNNFGRFLQYAIDGDDVVIIKNGKEVARMISREKSVSFLTDSMLGILKGDYDSKAISAERHLKYESVD